MEEPKLKLYSYWRSSCSHRVRIALNLKGIKYEYKAVNLLNGEHFSAEFTKLNPISFVPVLVDGDIVISDSFAIIMYLDEKYPQHPLLPTDLQKKAVNYQAANIVSSSIQPLQNLAVLKYIEEKVGPHEKIPWVQSHITRGFLALEKLLEGYAGKYATGDDVNLADLFIAPQVQGAIKRFNVDMSPLESQVILALDGNGVASCVSIEFFDIVVKNDQAEFPILSRLHEAYNDLQAFQDAAPEKQPDAPDI